MCVVVGLCRPARADSVADYIARGTEAFGRGHYATASAALAHAYALEPQPLLLFNIAQAERKGGNLQLAHVLYERYGRVADDDSLKREAGRNAAAVRRQLRRRGLLDSDVVGGQIALGSRLFSEGRFGEAARALCMAYALEPDPALLFNLAQALRKGDHPLAALGVYRRYLAVEPAGKLAEEARGHVAALEAYPAALAAAARTSGQPLVPQGRGPLRPLAVAPWIVGGAGLLMAGAGAVLWGLDGHQRCPKADIGHCARELDGAPAGIALVALGGAALGAAIVMLVVDRRQGGGLARMAAARRGGHLLEVRF